MRWFERATTGAHVHWYIDVLKKYVTFSGRARRTEFWMFTLISVVISIILSVVDHLIGTDVGSRQHSGMFTHTYNGGLLSGLYGLAVLLPSLAVQARRLHDTGRTGWWILIGLIPFFGGIVLLVFDVLPGSYGPNRYGPDPKGGDVPVSPQTSP